MRFDIVFKYRNKLTCSSRSAHTFSDLTCDSGPLRGWMLSFYNLPAIQGCTLLMDSRIRLCRRYPVQQFSVVADCRFLVSPRLQIVSEASVVFRSDNVTPYVRSSSHCISDECAVVVELLSNCLLLLAVVACSVRSTAVLL